MRYDLRFPDGRGYPIEVVAGGLDGLGAAVAEVVQGRVVVVASTVVAPLYLDVAGASLKRAGLRVDTVVIPDGEANKNLDTWRALVEALLDRGVDRRTALVALGGGVTGDLVGFAAASVLRGVPFVQVPTTLLAMVDSSVGGKVGVDTRHGKNLVGAFHQPLLVYAAMETLATLDAAELRSGLGEVIKHGVLGAPDLFELCVRRAEDIGARDGEVLTELVWRSIEVKAKVVTQDEREDGLRAILNFGHTVGHAIETSVGFGGLRHGECVVLGMLAEARWAQARGACGPQPVEALLGCARRLGLEVRAPGLDQTALLAASAHDKKRVGGSIRTAVLEAIGRVRLESVPVDEVATMLSFVR